MDGVAITNEVIAEYVPRVKSIARKYVGRNGAELDDLIQEGLIFIWLSLKKQIMPSMDLVDKRMKNWVRYLGRTAPKDYTEMLPFELYEEGNTVGA